MGHSEIMAQIYPVGFWYFLTRNAAGRPPKLDVRPMKSIGDGVFELKDSDESAWYRMIYLARKNNVIFVLDCFEKDSRKTEKHDIKRATARLKQARRRFMEERKHARHKQAK